MHHMRTHNTTHNKNKMPDIKNFYMGDENLVLHIFIRPHASQHTKRIKIAHKHRNHNQRQKPARKQKNYTQPSHQHKSKPFPATNTTKIRTNLIHFVYIKHPNKKTHTTSTIFYTPPYHIPQPHNTLNYT